MANYIGNPNNLNPFSFLENDPSWDFTATPLMANSNFDYQNLMGFYNDQIPTYQTSQLINAKLLENGDSSIAQQPITTTTTTTTTTSACTSSMVLSGNNNNVVDECSRSFNKRKAEDLAESSSSFYSSSPNDRLKNKHNMSRGKKSKNSDKDQGRNTKEVVHVRARRGQATDSHSIAERVRRGKINERLRCLKDIVPGCYKTMGMAVMLDEIINYVQSLKNQVEFLSMKLTAASQFHDFNSDSEHVEKKQKISACNSDETQDVERITSKAGYEEALLPNFNQSAWPF